jgi:hypothetical protein
MIAGVYLATDEQATGYADETVPLVTYPSVGAKFITHVEMCTLAALATRTLFDDWLDEMVATDEPTPEGPWQFRISDKIAAVLRDLAPERVGPLAADWGDTAELSHLPLATLIDTVEGLRQIGGLTTDALHLHLWISL